MEKGDLEKILQDLIQVDIDAVHSYARILGEVSDQVVRSRLEDFLGR